MKEIFLKQFVEELKNHGFKPNWFNKEETILYIPENKTNKKSSLILKPINNIEDYYQHRLYLKAKGYSNSDIATITYKELDAYRDIDTYLKEKRMTSDINFLLKEGYSLKEAKEKVKNIDIEKTQSSAARKYYARYKERLIEYKQNAKAFLEANNIYEPVLENSYYYSQYSEAVM